MSGLTNQLKETNKLLEALHNTKQKKRKLANRSNQKFSRVGKKKGKPNVRELPILLTRSAVITLLLLSVAIIIGGIEYFSDKEANAVINTTSTSKKIESTPVTLESIEDKELLEALSKK